MAEVCERCGVNGDEVRLFDGIYEGRMSSLCERCSIIENIPIIKKPAASQLRESERGVEGVYDRMKRMSGIREEKGDETYFQEDKLEELEKHPELELPEKDSLNLVDYFHWEVMKNRRRRGMSQKQLAENLGESEIVIQMIEKAKLPENAEVIIRKLEQLFQIKLRKVSERERMLSARDRVLEPILLGEDGKELEVIPEEEGSVFKEDEVEEPSEHLSHQLSQVWEVKREPEVECKVKEFGLEKKKMIYDREVIGESQIEKFEEKDFLDKFIPEKPAEQVRDFDLDKVDPRGVSIGELQRLHKRKVEVTRQEQIEEQRKIEERQRILEAHRERDRLKMEERKKAEQIEIQKAREERNRIDEERKHEIEERQKRESEDIDQYLGGSELLGGEQERVEDLDSVKEFDREFI